MIVGLPLSLWIYYWRKKTHELSDLISPSVPVIIPPLLSSSLLLWSLSALLLQGALSAPRDWKKTLIKLLWSVLQYWEADETWRPVSLLIFSLSLSYTTVPFRSRLLPGVCLSYISSIARSSGRPGWFDKTLFDLVSHFVQSMQAARRLVASPLFPVIEFFIVLFFSCRSPGYSGCVE